MLRDALVIHPCPSDAALEGTPAILDPQALQGTNDMELFVYSNSQEQALLLARLDNLGKGASGAAVQNLELMLGLASPDPTLSFLQESMS